MGSSPGDHPIARHLKVLLPSSSTSHKLRISDELAQHWDGGGGAALVVGPFGKVWRVEAGRDADGAFLGRGWPEFAAAHGFAAGWFLVFRREAAAGVPLTVKAFDTTCCLREFGRPLTVAANYGSGGGSGRPQFIKVLLPPFMIKMHIPPKFVQNYIAEPEKGSSMAVLSPLYKFCRVTVEMDQSGNVFFSGGWPQFLASHGITQGDAVLLRYEGNMVFTVKVFGPDGCQKGCKDQDTSHSKGSEQSDKTTFVDIETKEEDLSSFYSRKCKNMAKKPDSKENSKRLSSCTTSPNKMLSPAISVYEIGPPSWMKREINAYMLSDRLMVAGNFCKAIGLRKTSEITLRTTAGEGQGIRSWQARFLVYGNRSRGQLTRGWRAFCIDNGLKEGDICTFNIIETKLWHVDITRGG